MSHTIEQTDAHIMGTYGRSEVVLDHGTGATCTDENGNAVDGLRRALSSGAVDRKVNPEDTRKYLIAAFDSLLTKGCMAPRGPHPRGPGHCRPGMM